MIFNYLTFSRILKINERESLVGTQEQNSKFNNLGSKEAFLIILFVAFREFFV